VIMSAGVADIVKKFSVQWDEVAVYFYKSRRFLWRKRLVLVDGAYAGATPVDMEPYFRPSVGLVGAAFADQEVIGRNWREYVESAIQNGRAAWKNRSEKDRYKLNWGQLQVSPRLEGMVASPVFDKRNRPVGCILIGGSLKLDQLNDGMMALVFADLAGSLLKLGAPPSGWWRMHE